MSETPILFTCKKCGCVDLPENFNGVHKYNDNGGGVPMRMIYVGCPNCDNEVFFSHFAIWQNPEPINFDETKVSLGHEFSNKWQKSELGENGEK